MKPRKTRIKATTKSNGRKIYQAQHQSLFGTWYNFTDLGGISPWAHTNAYGYSNTGTTLEDAQRQIDNYIEAFEREEIRRKGKDILAVEYIKYP